MEHHRCFTRERYAHKMKERYTEGRRAIPRSRLWWPNLLILALDIGLLYVGVPLIAFHAFLFLHECGHSTFSRYKGMNFLAGHAASLLCGIPYYSWKHIHAQHHL